MVRFVEEEEVGAFEHFIDIDAAIWAELGVFDQPAFAFVNDNGDVEVNVGSFEQEELAARVQELIDS